MAKGNAIAAAVLASAGNPGSPSGGPAVTGGLSPLVASYVQQYSVNRPYSPLPRPVPTFLEGAFGPGSPIVAMPIDPPREDTHRPNVRRFQYEVNYNFPVGTPGSEGYKLAPFTVLRDLADRYSVARSCVDKRKAEITGLKWDVVATPEAEHAMADDDKARADWEQRRAKVVDFFSHPDSDRAKYPTFGTWLSGLLEDRFVIDAVAVHLVPPRKKGAGPFGSDIASLDLIDGSTIRPMLNTLGATPKPPAVGYQAYEWGVPRADLMSVITGADAGELSEPVADFRADQLIYMRESPRAFTPYGFSCLEKALKPIQIGLARQQYQGDFFDVGTVPAIFVVPGPDVATPQQIRQLQDALNSLGQGIPEKHRVIVLPPGSKTEPQKQASLADQFDEWIVSQVAMPFGLTPMDLGVTPRVSAVQTPSESRELSQINSDKGSQTRIEPVCDDLKTVIFDFVIQDLFGQKDMEWSWGLSDRGKNRAAKIQEHVDLIQNGLESIDEGRTDLGKTPWGLPETSVPLVFTPTGPVPLQAVAMDGQQPAAVPGQPGQAALPAGQQQVSDDELTTPAHEAAQDLPETSSSEDGDSDAAGAAKQARQAAELEYLARHLRKGRTVAAFRFDHLPPEAAAAAEKARPQGVRAAVDAARQAARGQRHASPRQGADLRAAAARLGAAAGEAAQIARLLTADRETAPRALAAVKAAKDDEEDHADWPGWQRDLELAGIYADKIREALTAAVDTEKLARQWTAKHPQPSGGTAKAQPPQVKTFLAATMTAITAALASVLPGAWTEGYALGRQSAKASAEAAGNGSAALDLVDWGEWQPGDVEAAAQVAGPGLRDLLADQEAQIKSIASSRLEELGDILAEHLSSPETSGGPVYSVSSLASALRSVLDNPSRALMVATTEIARAVSAAAVETYRAMGVDRVRLSTAGDQRVCPACAAIAARGAVPLGEVSLPVHPDCRCSWTVAPSARKAAGDPLASAPQADPETVYRQLARNYRPEGIAWVRDLPWRGPVPVPLDRVDWDHLGTWAAAHDGAHVARFESEIKAGDDPHPAVMVQVPGSPLLKVIDGHHRSLARRRLGQPVPAYVGLADSDALTAPWFMTHLYQVHSGGDPLNKRRTVSKESVGYRPAADPARSCGTCVMFRPGGTCDLVRGSISADATCDRWEARGAAKALGDEDPSRVAFLLIRAVNDEGKWRYLLQKRGDDGSWGLPGGKAHDGEVPWDAAVREATEELGDLPPVTPSAVWTRAKGDHVVFTYLVELNDLFSPSADGETAGETAGWGWFRKRDVPDLDLHPAMRKTWEALDFGEPLLGGKPVEAPAAPAGSYLPAVTVAGQVFPAAAKAASGYDLKPLSCMISLDIPDGLIEPLPGGVSDFHITICYCGQPDDQAFAEICRRAAAAAALVPGPLNGVISGLGTFPPSGGSDGKTPVWAGVTLPGAEPLREALADLSASEHLEWHPHVTRAYVDPEAAGDLPDPLPPVPVTFTRLSVHRSDGKLSRFTLGGSDDPGEPHQGDEAVCPCGAPVVYDEANGWQHADGSISHDDGESVSDKAGNAPAWLLKAGEGDAGDIKAAHLIRWYEHGEGAALIGWATPGDLTRCHAIASKHLPSDQAWGFCNDRHRAVLGTWNDPKD